MASYEFKNNARSTVADNPLAAGATTLNVASGEGGNFPSSFPFKITLWDAVTYPNPGSDILGMEIVKCTGRTADALTIVRAQEGTADVAHSFGERAAMLITAGYFNDAITGIVIKLDGIEDGAEVNVNTNRVLLFASSADVATNNAAQYPAEHGYTAPTDGHPESFTLDFDDTRQERGNWDIELPNVAATAIITVHYRGSGDAGNVMLAAGFIGIDDNEDSLTPIEPVMVDFSAEDTVTADTNHRSISTVHTFAASVADSKMIRCAVGRTPSSESDSMVGDAKMLFAVIEWVEP